MKLFLKKLMQNLAIMLLIIIGVKNILLSLPARRLWFKFSFYGGFSGYLSSIVHHALPFLLGVLMLLTAFRLYKRVRFAWLVEVVALSVTLGNNLLVRRSILYPAFFIELFVLLVLLLSHKDFSRLADPITVKLAFQFIGVSLVLVLLNAALGLFLLRESILNIHNLYDSVLSSIKLLVFMDTGVLAITGKAGEVYANGLIIINWACILSFTGLLLKPLVYSPLISHYDKEKAKQLLNVYGQNPLSYLALEDDKKYFFDSEGKGVCAYRIAGKVFVVCGDMICEESQSFRFLNEIFTFCKQNGYEIMFLNTTEHFIELYKTAGFGVVKYGEDACFELSQYSLAGGKVAKVRAAIHHADALGITVKEYMPLLAKDIAIEKQIAEISAQWLNEKGGKELSFMLGGTGLSDPMDRRYFYAVDTADTIWGFGVFLPYANGESYLVDVTRRRSDAPQGVLEKIVVEAFLQMKSEGVKWGNLGLSPLYNINETESTTLIERVFSYVYDNMNKSYNFKSLHHSKLKYAPTDWQTRYVAYYPKPFSLNFCYAMLEVQMPGRIAKSAFASLNLRKQEAK